MTHYEIEKYEEQEILIKHIDKITFKNYADMWQMLKAYRLFAHYLKATKQIGLHTTLFNITNANGGIRLVRTYPEV